MAFDLLLQSNLLRTHVSGSKVILGLNHTMTDYATNRRKDLDLVIARSSGSFDVTSPSFAELPARYGLDLASDEQDALASLPTLRRGHVGAVLVAMEAKACMTAHIKSLPRLYDELNSSHLCVHGASTQAIAIGYAQINAADHFVSPVINARWAPDEAPVITNHKQPADTARVLRKLSEMPRRSNNTEVGFDGFGVTVLDFANDGGSVDLVTRPPAPAPGAPFNYDDMIVRIANEYDTRFSSI